MTIRFPASRLIDKELRFDVFLGQDYVATVAGLRCGWILSGGGQWWWSMTGPCCGHARINNVGTATSLEQAQNQFRDAYQAWLRWALAEKEPVVWFGASRDELATLEGVRDAA